MVTEVEGIRADTTMDSLGGLKPAFDKAGTITAANASQISDGGSAVIVMSKKAAEARGVKPLGEVLGYGMVAGPDNASLLHQPARSILKALERTGMKVSDIDLFELNEAFASQSIACIRELGLDPGRVNVYGGAIALGHALGSSGSRMLATLVHALGRRRARYGLATMCIGVGQGIAMVVERC